MHEIVFFVDIVSFARLRDDSVIRHPWSPRRPPLSVEIQIERRHRARHDARVVALEVLAVRDATEAETRLGAAIVANADVDPSLTRPV